MAGPGYSEQEIRIIAGWLSDGKSAGQIASDFSVVRGEPVSRNAIIGIVHRNKVLGAIGFGQSSARPKGERVRQPASKVAKALPKAKSFVHSGNIASKREARAFDPPYAPPRMRHVDDGINPKTYDLESRRLPLPDLGARDCRWPVNDPERGSTFLFCAQTVTGEGHYCPHHARRAVAATERECAADRRRVAA